MIGNLLDDYDDVTDDQAAAIQQVVPVKKTLSAPTTTPKKTFTIPKSIIAPEAPEESEEQVEPDEEQQEEEQEETIEEAPQPQPKKLTRPEPMKKFTVGVKKPVVPDATPVSTPSVRIGPVGIKKTVPNQVKIPNPTPAGYLVTKFLLVGCHPQFSGFHVNYLQDVFPRLAIGLYGSMENYYRTDAFKRRDAISALVANDPCALFKADDSIEFLHVPLNPGPDIDAFVTTLYNLGFQVIR